MTIFIAVKIKDLSKELQHISLMSKTRKTSIAENGQNALETVGKQNLIFFYETNTVLSEYKGKRYIFR